jgi:hypothetical protein
MNRPRHGLASAGIASALRAHLVMAGMATSAAVPLLLLVAVLPRGLVLPTLSVLLLAAAGILALIAWGTEIGRRSEKITLWDLCGACAFIGFAAAILSKPENILIAFAPAVGG